MRAIQNTGSGQPSTTIDPAMIARQTPTLDASRNIWAVLHWADGRVWNVIVPGGQAWHFALAGHRYCFNPTGDVDQHGVAIWVECLPSEHKMPN